jgi:hypothetical protein
MGMIIEISRILGLADNIAWRRKKGQKIQLIQINMKQFSPQAMKSPLAS